MAPGYSTGSSGVASAGTSSQGNSTLPANQSGSAAARVASAAAPVDPELAARLQQYRDLMVKEATTGTAPAQNTAVSRRYLMVDRATYMQNGGGAK